MSYGLVATSFDRMAGRLDPYAADTSFIRGDAYRFKPKPENNCGRERSEANERAIRRILSELADYKPHSRAHLLRGIPSDRWERILNTLTWNYPIYEDNGEIGLMYAPEEER